MLAQVPISCAPPHQLVVSPMTSCKFDKIALHNGAQLARALRIPYCDEEVVLDVGHLICAQCLKAVEEKPLTAAMKDAFMQVIRDPAVYEAAPAMDKAGIDGGYHARTCHCWLIAGR